MLIMKRSIGWLVILALGLQACAASDQPISTSQPTFTVESATATEALVPATVPPTDAPEPASTLPAGWLIYQDAAYGFEIDYPDSGIPVNGNPPTIGTENAVRIDLPFLQGTNLTEKYLQVNIGSGDQESCSSPFTKGYSPGAVETTSEKIGDLIWKREHQTDAGAGNFYEFTAYTIARNGVCVTLSFLLHSTNPDNYDTPPAEFDVRAESMVFEQIVQSFQWVQ
jgi:hypothetical protein